MYKKWNKFKILSRLGPLYVGVVLAHKHDQSPLSGDTIRNGNRDISGIYRLYKFIYKETYLKAF